MNLESSGQFKGQNEHIQLISDEDMAAAVALIEEDERLKNHPRVKQLLANDFITEDGRSLDAGNFLAAVLKSLETKPTANENEVTTVLAEAMVVHSRPTGQ